MGSEVGGKDDKSASIDGEGSSDGTFVATAAHDTTTNMSTGYVTDVWLDALPHEYID